MTFHPVSETNHFTTGSKCPELKPGLLRVYSMRFCPYAQRTRLVLAAKQIQHEVVNVNLVTKPEWLEGKNPLTKVPILEFDDGKIIFESLVSADYLDETHLGSRSLNNPDPFKKAQDRMFVELFNPAVGPLYKLYRTSLDDEATWKSTLQTLEHAISVFEVELAKRGTPFFGGAKPGMLDYMIWPFFERYPSLTVLSKGLYKVNMDTFPTLTKWNKEMIEDDGVKPVYITPENHAKFITSYLTGTPDYDMTL